VEPLKRFDHVAALPAFQVSPLGARMTPNVASYVKADSFATLGSQLRGLPREQQRAILRDGSWGPAVKKDKKDDARKSNVVEDFDLAYDVKDVRVLPDVQRIEGGRKGARTPWDSLATERCMVLTAGAGTGKSFMLGALVKYWRARSRERVVFVN